MLKCFTSAALQQIITPRCGELRLGQQICLPDATVALDTILQNAAVDGCRYVLLGIPEDIGPRANLGQAGAVDGWAAFLSKFLNLQANSFVNASQLMLLGEVDCSDLQQQAAGLSTQEPAQLNQLRQLVSMLDQRVYQVVAAVFAAGLYPLVIGGGHNNSLPLLTALQHSSGKTPNCANLDPHSDFRPLEGRHSGNGFSYAHQDGYLKQYFVLGLHELKNSAASLTQLQQAGAEFCSYQRIFVRQELSYQQALDQCIDMVIQGDGDIGIEVDTDSINLMPVSAFTNCGISVQAAEQFVYQLARLPRSRYLHLAEAAPAQHPAGKNAGMNEAGQVLSALVYAFIQGKQDQAQAI